MKKAAIEWNLKNFGIARCSTRVLLRSLKIELVLQIFFGWFFGWFRERKLSGSSKKLILNLGIRGMRSLSGNFMEVLSKDSLLKVMLNQNIWCGSQFSAPDPETLCILEKLKSRKVWKNFYKKDALYRWFTILDGIHSTFLFCWISISFTVAMNALHPGRRLSKDLGYVEWHWNLSTEV